LSEIYIMKVDDCPLDGVTTSATVGLSNYPLHLDGKELDARVEFIGVADSGTKNFGNFLATLAFCVINSKFFCAPGRIFQGILDMYSLSSTMSDIYFTYPFIWEDRLKSIKIGESRIAWLLAVPISKSKSAFAQLHGSAKLESLLEENSADIFDINRPSVI